MSYGVSVITNTNDEVVVDGTNLPLVIVSNGFATKTTFQDGQSNTHGQYSIPVPTGLTNQMLFIKWPVGMNMINDGISGGNYNLVNTFNNGPSSLEYWVCSSKQLTSNGGYGIEIYDASGNLNFTSDESYMRIREIMILKDETAGVFTKTHSSVPTNYPVTVPLSRPLLQQQGATWVWFQNTLKRSSTTQFAAEQGRFLGATQVGQVPNFPFTLGHSPTVLFGQVV